MNNTNIALALQIVFDLLQHASNLSALLGKALTENRDLTEEEIQSVVSADDVAKARLDAAIASLDAPSTDAEIEAATLEANSHS